jgi:hypothetical protein
MTSPNEDSNVMRLKPEFVADFDDSTIEVDVV